MIRPRPACVALELGSTGNLYEYGVRSTEYLHGLSVRGSKSTLFPRGASPLTTTRSFRSPLLTGLERVGPNVFGHLLGWLAAWETNRERSKPIAGCIRCLPTATPAARMSTEYGVLADCQGIIRDTEVRYE